MSRRTIKLALLALIVLDIVFPVIIFGFPGLWNRLFHGGAGADDPIGLLHRLGAGWAAFALWQIVAYIKWEREPGWLAVVAGIRWTEIWADWVYLYYAHEAGNATLIAWIGLGGASPVNALAGWYFYRAYRYYKCKAPDAPPPPPGPARAV